jgi:hypothetical protein
MRMRSIVFRSCTDAATLVAAGASELHRNATDWNATDWNATDWNAKDWNAKDWDAKDWDAKDWDGRHSWIVHSANMRTAILHAFIVLCLWMPSSMTAHADDLDGMVLCGYQGWFRCEDDGSDNGWHHYAARGKFEPGHASIDLWPDVSELAPEERFATPFRHADGRVAEVFSSVNEATVRRHFRWMREYGIDGAFVQRFATTTLKPRTRLPADRVLSHCRKSAAAEGRKWALMYDLSGLKSGDFPRVKEDWKRLRDEGVISKNEPAGLRYRGKPLVALWGLGFKDRPRDLDAWSELIRFFRDEGHAVMVGVPCYWRTLTRDSIDDPRLLEVIATADIVSPWSVGRFRTPEQAAARTESLLKPDLAWCNERNLGYLPVAFPGFSWHNLKKGRGEQAEPDAIPRRGGRFLWSQAVAVKQAGISSLYIAMFDELDEGTAVFKVTQDPPVGASPFVSEPGLPSDHYLWISGEIGRMLRGEGRELFPTRK